MTDDETGAVLRGAFARGEDFQAIRDAFVRANERRRSVREFVLLSIKWTPGDLGVLTEEGADVLIRNAIMLVDKLDAATPVPSMPGPDTLYRESDNLPLCPLCGWVRGTPKCCGEPIPIASVHNFQRPGRETP